MNYILQSIANKNERVPLFSVLRITHLVHLADSSLQGQITLDIQLHSCWRRSEEQEPI